MEQPAPRSSTTRRGDDSGQCYLHEVGARSLVGVALLMDCYRAIGYRRRRWRSLKHLARKICCARSAAQ
jgi:hypothetical protein